MKTVTYQQFLKFNPCWQYDKDKDKAAKLEEIGRRKAEWTALDVLDLPDEEVSPEDKLWAVLREEFVSAPILHEFGCRCAEEALKLVENPDPRSVAAIEAKRKWMRGEITGKELQAARDAARAARDAASEVACEAAWNAARAARAAARTHQTALLREMLAL